MDILGIGPLELIFILIIALIVLGPSDMVKAGRTVGRFLRKLVTSPGWRAVQQTSRDLRYLPNKLIREAGLEELEKDLPNPKEIRDATGIDQLKQDTKQWQKDLSDWTTPPPPNASSPNTISPPPSPSPKTSSPEVEVADSDEESAKD